MGAGATTAGAIRPEASVRYAVEARRAGAWLRTLGPEKRAAIQDLHRLRPAWNLVFVLFVAIWVAAGWVTTHVEFWPVRLLGYATIGVVIHGMGNFMHEAIHGNLFRNRRLDGALGTVAGAGALFSMTAYKVTHLIHHRYNRTERDPDDVANLTRNRAVLSVFFYAWFLVGILLYLFHVPITALVRGNRRERRHVVLEHVLLAAAYGSVVAAAAAFGFMDTLVHVWFLPMAFALMYGNVRGWAEHMMTVPGHPLTQTRTVTSNRVLSFFNLNLNYHIEHHLFPSVPWYNLRKVHLLLREDFEKAGSSVYRSYVRFVLDAFRVGVHGVADGRR